MKMNNCTACEMKDLNKTSTNSFSTPVASLGFIIASIVILINFCVLVIFLKSKSVRANRHHNLVIGLSISDLTLGVSGLIASCRLLIPAWSGAFIPCLFSTVFLGVAVFMSLFQTFLISFHRFLVAIGSPWNDRLLQGKRKYVIYVISWSIVMTLHFVFVSPESKSEMKICNVIKLYGENFGIFFGVYGVFTMFLLMATIILYILTLTNVRKRYMKTYAWQIQNTRSGIEQSQNKCSTGESNLYITQLGKKRVFESLKIVGIIIFFLILFTGPFVCVMFRVVFGINPSHKVIFVVCLLTAFNSAINPFIYSWKIDSLRKEFQLFFKVCLSE